MYCAYSCLVCILAYLQRDTGCWTLECSCRRSLPAQGGSHSAFLHLGSVAISNFRLDRCDQVWSATSGLTAPWLLTALRKIDWKTNYSEIKHDWTCRFQLLERDDQYDWQLWLHWCLGWKLLHDGIICYNQPATSKPQCIWTCTDPFIIHQIGLPAFFCDQTGLLQEMIRHGKDYSCMTCVCMFEIVWSLSLQTEVSWTLWRICPWWTIAFGLCWESMWMDGVSQKPLFFLFVYSFLGDRGIRFQELQMGPDLKHPQSWKWI